MSDPAAVPTGEAPAEPEPERQPAPADEREAPLVEMELLVEDVSIDGMCGVY
jgi:mycofactocin precursor